MKSILLTICLLLLTSFSSFAGQERGNGGDGVACPTGYRTYRFFVLDYYEDYFFEDLEKKFEGKNWRIIVSEVIQSLEKIDPIRYQQLSEILTEIDDRLVWPEGALPDIDDSYHQTIGKYCVLIQSAVQFSTPSGIRYHLNRYMWKNFNEVQRAGLILHEMIYEVALRNDDSLSKSNEVREFNRFLMRTHLGIMPPNNYIVLLQGLGIFKKVQYKSFKLNVSSVIFSKYGHLIRARSAYDPYPWLKFDRNGRVEAVYPSP